MFHTICIIDFASSVCQSRAHHRLVHLQFSKMYVCVCMCVLWLLTRCFHILLWYNDERCDVCIFAAPFKIFILLLKGWIQFTLQLFDYQHICEQYGGATIYVFAQAMIFHDWFPYDKLNTVLIHQIWKINPQANVIPWFRVKWIIWVKLITCISYYCFF